jgi:Coenzyme PQQ synthesis protein D (PqqD)
MQLPVPHPDVIARTLPDGCVLFNTRSEVYFGLNETGTAVWEALAAGATSEESLVAAVRAKWPDASPSAVVCDVRELLADLSVEGLVVDTAASLA